MNYEKITVARFAARLRANTYKNPSAALRAIEKADWSDAERRRARRLVAQCATLQSNRPPILTAKVVDGLRECYAMCSAELEAGVDGAFGRKGGGGPVVQARAAAALIYLDRLLDWYDAQKKSR